MDRVTFRQISHVTCGVAMIDPTEKPFHYLIPPFKEKCFNDSEFSQLQQMYKLLYSNSSIISISHFYYECKQMLINNEEFISSNSRSQRSPAIGQIFQELTHMVMHLSELDLLCLTFAIKLLCLEIH